MTTIHTCPACNLRFAFVGEMIDHVREDHHPHEEGAAPAPWGHVTVPLDPAGDNGVVMQVATKIAQQSGQGLSLVAVPGGGIDARGTHATLQREAAAVRDADEVPCAWHLLPGGDIDDAIVEVATEGDTTLICMATHARGPLGEAVLGSVSESVMRRSPVPVVLLGPSAKPQEGPFTHLIVGLDGSDTSQRALDAAASLAPRMNAALVLVQVLDPNLQIPSDAAEHSMLQRAASRLPASRTTWDVLHDTDAARAITGAAAALPNAMIVVGTHGRTGLRRVVAGSVALDVVRGSMAPVMVVGSGMPA